jgi:hypothetical protein
VEPESFASLIKDEKERRRRFAQGVIIITQVTEESIKFSTLITRARVNTRKETKGVIQANMEKWRTNELSICQAIVSSDSRTSKNKNDSHQNTFLEHGSLKFRNITHKRQKTCMHLIQNIVVHTVRRAILTKIMLV